MGTAKYIYIFFFFESLERDIKRWKESDGSYPMTRSELHGKRDSGEKVGSDLRGIQYLHTGQCKLCKGPGDKA